MSQKVILLCDPGIDGAFAAALALFDPDLEVLAILATPGNVSAEQATRNVRTLIDQMDPPRLPRLGGAPAVEYPLNGHKLHGTTGLGGVEFPSATTHHLPPSEKLLVELAKTHPNEITLICLGPLTVFQRACDLNQELAALLKRIICLGGTYREPGNAGPVSEFHFACDPKAARHLLHCGAPVVLIPLDLMRRVLFSPTDLLSMPQDSTPVLKFLRSIIPFGISAMSNVYGVEGFYLKDVLGVYAAARLSALPLRPMHVDVETHGKLTAGMSVFDQRPWVKNAPNVELATDVETSEVRDYIREVLAF